MSQRLITLLTDFGRTDTYVGQMHAVIASVAPESRVVDFTHDIAPQNILQAAVMLEDAVEACPPGTIHVAVVDPGVGSQRKAIAAEIGPWIFVGPDNGVFTAVIVRWPVGAVVELTERRFHREIQSTTFHGRDIFSPVAAHLSNGVPLASLGPTLLPLLVQIPIPQPRRETTCVAGVVLWVDHFGNLITNLSRQHLDQRSGRVKVGTVSDVPLVDCYAAGQPDGLFALFGSSGRLEIAVRNGSAASRLQTGGGMRVEWRAHDPS